MEVVCDIETDGLDPKRVWIIVCREVDGGQVHIFREPDIDKDERRRFVDYAQTVSRWIGHNFIKFDYLTVLSRFFREVKIDPLSILDTLVCSRLFNFAVSGGHGLEAWGVRLGHPKPVITDWSQGLTDKMVERCVEDTMINLKLYRFLEKHIKHPAYTRALETEHKMEFVCWDMTRNGFGFNKDLAVKLQDEIKLELEKLDNEILSCFPPRYVPIRTVEPKSTKAGTIKLTDFRWAEAGHDFTQYTVGAPFTLIKPEPFNPASPKQVVERLNEAGWKPYNKTKGHIQTEQALRRSRNPTERAELSARLDEYRVRGWSIDEENLDTLPEDAPEGARKLAQRILLASRVSVLQEWLNAYNESTSSIHGQFMSIGSWTQRMSHIRPNQANIPTKPDVKNPKAPTPVEEWKIKYSSVLRQCWQARKGRRLIGVDADGIQLRILAHYMNDKDFIEALVNGDKEKGTDAHTLNALKLGLTQAERDRAKTFIYAWLLGAGLDKVGHILHTNSRESKIAVDSFIAGYPGLKRLKDNVIPEDAKRGYFFGLDGRLVPVPNEHKVLAGYLQNGEQLIMKTAALIWRQELRKLQIPFWMVDFVHDEWQTETEDDDKIAQKVIEVQAQSIVQAGLNLNMNCPLAGQGKMGYNWSETH